MAFKDVLQSEVLIEDVDGEVFVGRNGDALVLLADGTQQGLGECAPTLGPPTPGRGSARLRARANTGQAVRRRQCTARVIGVFGLTMRNTPTHSKASGVCGVAISAIRQPARGDPKGLHPTLLT